ncbi:growth-regulating factor 1-like isoform X2 [Andrographis paniculata]|uniref:growth-regulating factor 1-like isoform X2 n=1 Tax=Andrographis paniculata TaxID=175694 RepID=UPI0021E74C2E|nr:growth-regulating factor 1-like isoform X2 [Andrographis paniculata]
MDFGAVPFDSLLTPNTINTAPAIDINNNGKLRWGVGGGGSGSGSGGFLKLEGETPINEEEEEEEEEEEKDHQFKIAKTCSNSSSFGTIRGAAAPARFNVNGNGNGTDSYHYNHHMLSFSSPNSHTLTFPYYRNNGYGSTGKNGGNMVSVFRGPFTPSQWMELEHQALIYKYITANVPIPNHLLNPIRKAFESAAAGFPPFAALRSNALGWGAFHLGFASTDPEPGRCRRTDGKKWRCSRDAVADQKYCERHMNRGRHRSRKPVEGQPGHSATGSTTTTTNTATAANTSKLTPMAAAGGVSNSLGRNHQLTNLQPGINRSLPNGGENSDGATTAYQHETVLLMMSPKSGSLMKDNNNAYQDSLRPEFGLVCSDSLLNPLNKSSSLVHNDNKSHHNSLREFMNPQPDRTQLSISIPMATTNYLSNEKLTASPLRLSHELEMGLGVGSTVAANGHHRQSTDWVPISWEPSMGGPLGEALHTTTGECRNTKPLNLIDGWDNSPRIASPSPTGVLQRGTFGSLSNSSAGSSPSRPTLEGASLCNGLLNPYLPAI